MQFISQLFHIRPNNLPPLSSLKIRQKVRNSLKWINFPSSRKMVMTSFYRRSRTMRMSWHKHYCPGKRHSPVKPKYPTPSEWARYFQMAQVKKNLHIWSNWTRSKDANKTWEWTRCLRGQLSQENRQNDAEWLMTRFRCSRQNTYAVLTGTQLGLPP